MEFDVVMFCIDFLYIRNRTIIHESLKERI